MVSAKGKEKVPSGGDGKGKRKWSGGDDKTGGQKRKNRGVLQFFDDAAYQVDEDEDSSDDSMFDDDDFFEDECGSELKSNNEPGKVPQFPFIPKEEEMSEEEFERMLEERYKPGAGFVTYAEDGNEHNTPSEREIYLPSVKDPKIWKVKCTVGRERYSALCLMQKYVDLGPLGTKLQIVSALALDHVKGSIFIEAEKQNDIYEASKGLSTIYASRSAPLPNNEISRLLSVRSKSNGISEGMWARVKNGKYKGDLALVMAVNNGRKKVTVKLVPRIDLKAMAGKFGGGVTTKRTAIPPQRLISSSELDEFRPLIHCRRDRDTNEMVEVLDGMMLKDGYLYKKISIDSLSFWGVMPTEDELLKFEPSKKNETTDVQWLSQLFGEKKKKQAETLKQDKGGGKSEGSSSASAGNNFEMHELVFFGRKDFGVVLGTEKDDTVKVIKEGPEGQSVVNVKQSELKSASFDKKLFSVLDQNSKTISINDIVRVLDGPLKDRQGVVKKIYKGVVFLYDESEQGTSGYICVKACLCEKVNFSGKTSNEKGSEPGPSGFVDLPPSPKTPLSSDRSLPERDNKSNFKREDNEMFSVGQPLRIKVGPLKGYLCRVLAVRRSDVTVKLDSQHKILTVKSEHLSEVGGRNRAISHGEESGSIKPFDFLGTQDGARDWMEGAAPPTEGNKWNAGGSTERSSWSAALPSSSFSIPKDSSSADDDAKKGTEDSGWQVGSTSNQNSSWGAAAADKRMVSDTGPADGLGTSNGWNQATAVNSGPDSWGKASEPRQDTSVETDKNDSWGKAAEKWSTVGDISGSKAAWGQSGASSEKQTGGWGNAGLAQPEASSWKKDSGVSDQSRGNTWQGTAVGSESGWKISADTRDCQTKSWDVALASEHATDNNPIEGWNKPKPVGADSGPSWHKQDDKSMLGQLKGTSSWSKQDGGSTWSTGGTSSWGKQPDVNATDGLKGWKKQNNHSENSKDSEGDQGIGSWKKDNRDDTFDGGRGSGGRRGRGGGRGGRDQYGRGRSFTHGQSTNWNKEAQYGSSDAGNHSSWGRDQTSGWGKAVSTDGIKKDDGESNVSVEGGWHTNKDGGIGGVDWGIGKTDEINTSGGSMSKSYNSESSDWGRISTKNEEAGAAGKGHDSWGNGNKPNDDNKSSWNTQTTPVDGNQSSEWNTKGGWGTQKASEPNAEGGSSTGWGQSNWSKSGTSDSTWSSKSNWSSGNGFQASNNQDDASGDGGRGGSWRGGRGGRGDRGGFRGRGRSDLGGFGGRGGSSWGGGSDRGGFDGRGGSDGEGGFRGRGGGFRGRGRGDWNNRAGDSNVEKTNSWSKGSHTEGWKSSGNGGSWNQTGTDNNQRQNQNSSWNQPSQGGSWNQGGSDNNQRQSWNQPKVEASSAAGGWGKELDSNKESVQTVTGVSGWGSSNASAKEGSGGWGKQLANKEAVGWGKPPANKEAGDWNSKGTATSDPKESVQTDTGVSGWGSSNASAKEGSGGWVKPPANKEAVAWGKPPANKEAGGWNSKGTATSDPTEKGQVEKLNTAEGSDVTWGKAAASSWGAASGSGNWKKPETTRSDPIEKGQIEKSFKAEGSDGSWGKPVASSWGAASGSESWKKPETTTSDPIEKGQVEKSIKAEGSDGTWGKPVASSWGAASVSGNWKKPETTTSDSIEKGQVEKSNKAEGSDGTWGKGLSKDGGPSDSSWDSGSKKGGW